MNRAMNTTDWSLLGATAVLLGSSFLFLNIAVAEIPPMTVAVARAAIAVPITWLVMRRLGARLPKTFNGWIPLIWLGLLTVALAVLEHQHNADCQDIISLINELVDKLGEIL